MSRTSLHGFSAFGLICITTGCAIFGPQLPLSQQAIELEETPFFAQTEYMCGPSALATVLQRTGLKITPDKLAEQVYVPGRRGSLQVEMIAATRQLDRLAVRLDQDLGAIVNELTAGRPVLVLQNLALRWLPVWHYAVVVGYDPVKDIFVLRSGTKSRLTMSRSRFERSWERADYWAIVVLKPGELPSSYNASRYVTGVVGLESVGKLDAAITAYQAGLTRWTSNTLLSFGYGNALYEMQEITAAVAVYRDLLKTSPDYIPAVNNLSQALAELGCRQEALSLLDGVSHSIDGSFARALSETRRSISEQAAGRCAD